jgi:response regulator NasT
VALPKLETAKNVKNLLVRNGFSVLGTCTTGAQALNQADGLRDGILICSYRLTDMLCTEIREYLPENFEILVLASPGVLQAIRGSKMISLAMPFKPLELLSTVHMLEEGIEGRRRKQKAIPKTRKPEEEKLIREAKELLMVRNHMTEEEAHRYVQKSSMDSGTNLVETAQMILALLN